MSADLNNLAMLYQDQGRNAEAEPFHQRALAIAEKALGPDHPDVGNDLLCLAQLSRARGRYAEAARLIKRALAITERALGPITPTSAQASPALPRCTAPRAATPRPSRCNSACV